VIDPVVEIILEFAALIVIGFAVFVLIADEHKQ